MYPFHSGRAFRLCIMAEGLPDGQLRILTPKRRRLIECLEEYARNRGWEPTASGIDHPSRARAILSELPESDAYLVVTDFPGCGETLSQLGRGSRPVAVLALGGLPEGFRTETAACPMRLFRFPQKHAGLSMGRYLKEQGHRRVAFFSTYASYGFSQQRHQGLVEGFEPRETGDGNGRDLIPYLADCDLEPNQGSTVPIWSPWYSQPNRFQAGERLPAGPMSDAERDYVGGLLRLITGKENHRMRSVRMFEAALKVTEVTAWVAATELIGEFAYSFLEKRGLFPASGPLLVALDDSSRLRGKGVTAFDQDVPGLAQAVLDFLAAPAEAIGEPGDFMEPEGRVDVRQPVAGPVEDNAP